MTIDILCQSKQGLTAGVRIGWWYLNDTSMKRFLKNAGFCRLYYFKRRGCYSIISRMNLLLSFADTAPRMFRMAFAVRPCFPITLPISELLTLSSMTDVVSLFTSVTSTSLGYSTSSLTILVTSSWISIFFS